MWRGGGGGGCPVEGVGEAALWRGGGSCQGGQAMWKGGRRGQALRTPVAAALGGGPCRMR